MMLRSESVSLSSINYTKLWNRSDATSKHSLCPQRLKIVAQNRYLDKIDFLADHCFASEVFFTESSLEMYSCTKLVHIRILVADQFCY